MKPRIMTLFCLLTALMALFLFSCLDSSTKPETPPVTTDVAAANAMAREGMNLLNQTIIDLGNTEPDINDSEDLMQQATFNNIKSKFDGALGLDANNPMANLGLAILAVVDINYDNELWSMLTDAGFFENGDKRILNNQFQFLATVPYGMMKQVTEAKDNSMSLLRVQNFIKNSILPRIDTAISRLDKAVAMADSTVLMIEVDDEEMVEVDCGEIYAFRAASKAVQAGFNMMLTYDWDMKDADGDYSWMDDYMNVDVPHIDDNWEPYHYEVVGNTLYMDYYDDEYEWRSEEAQRMEIQMKVMKYNMDNNPTFAHLTADGVAHLGAAKSAILGAAADVKNGVNYILAETDTGAGQDNDIIKIENIISLNDEIPPTDDGAPEFAQNWQNVNDIADWLTNEVLAGAYNLTLNDIDFQVNLSAFFNGAIPNIQAVLPYLHWNDPGLNWVEDSIEYTDGFQIWGNSYSFWYQGSYQTVNNINYVQKRYHSVDIDWGYDTDASGNPLAEDEFLHFPDYTFGGILPGMTRQKMIDLFG